MKLLQAEKVRPDNPAHASGCITAPRLSARPLQTKRELISVCAPTLYFQLSSASFSSSSCSGAGGCSGAGDGFAPVSTAVRAAFVGTTPLRAAPWTSPAVTSKHAQIETATATV